MPFEVNSKEDCVKFLNSIENTEEPYFSLIDGKITKITEEQFNNLNNDQHDAVYQKLKSVIEKFKDLTPKEHPKTLNKIHILCDKLFNTINPQTSLNELPIDLLGLILNHTSPKDINSLIQVNTRFYQSATHRAINKATILSINNNKLKLKDSLPSNCKTAEQAINWITKDKVACKSLTYADFRGFRDFNEGNLEELTKFCPSLNYLFIQSDTINKIEQLPESLTTLECSECWSLESLHKLPKSLTTLNCSRCRALESLPNLPESLTTFNYQGCWSLEENFTVPKDSEVIK